MPDHAFSDGKFSDSDHESTLFYQVEQLRFGNGSYARRTTAFDQLNPRQAGHLRQTPTIINKGIRA